MAYYVAKVLHMRPNEILDNWGVAELYVAFGEYANEKAKEQYEEWKSLDTNMRQKVDKPNQYAVYFHTTSESEEEWRQN